ncbi:TetR/AcrR family transcriptional regulator [Nonomuraea roseoviolacea subsp. roseoviolacea]|uniref:TetR/AcrR family transcriptional regulator n=1 Tax=Nonomuraea roseoviolacea TaxID=103837 RepID=UPI00336E0D33
MTRAESQERNRARILAAAHDEFAERGFRDVKIDDIAERAGLTRGAVYSNFPGKRALFFSVLADAYDVGRGGGLRGEEGAGPLLDEGRDGRPQGEEGAGGLVGEGRGGSRPGAEPRGGDVGWVLGAVARAWLDDPVPAGAMAVWREVVPQVQGEEGSRLAFAELMTLYATLLGLAMERLDGRPGRRMVRPATAALTLLQGASQRAALAAHPATRSRTVSAAREEEDVVRACERLARLDPGPAPLFPVLTLKPYSVDAPWAPPPAVDALRGDPLALDGDGLVVFLGLRRLSALEDVVRAAPAALPITLVAVMSDPGEHGPLARFALARMGAHLRAAVPAGGWPDVRIVCDESGRVAAAAGLPSVDDMTETAVRVSGGRLVRRADGRGAGYALASEHAEYADSSGPARHTDPPEDAGVPVPARQAEAPARSEPSGPSGHTRQPAVNPVDPRDSMSAPGPKRGDERRKGESAWP